MSEQIKTIALKGSKMIDPAEVIVEKGWNVGSKRYTAAEWKELKVSVKANGILLPLKGFKDAEGRTILTEGENRLGVVMELRSEGHEIKRIPMIIDSKPPSKEKRIMEALMSDQKVPFTMYQLGVWFQRLRTLGWSQAEISEKTGKKPAIVSNALKLTNAPRKVQAQLKTNKVSYIVVLDIMRSNPGDEEKQTALVMKAIQNAKGKKAKRSHVPGGRTKGPIGKLEEAVGILGMAEKRMKEQEIDIPAFEALIAILKNKKSTAEDIVRAIDPDFFTSQEETEAPKPKRKQRKKKEKS